MPDQLQLRGGTTAEHATFTGASKEVTIDTTKKTAVVHDASTAGGNPLMREDGANSALINGSAAAPALAFAAGDADNGIYSPGADQVAISTAGTGRLFVDEDGQVSVGVASPTSPLTVSHLTNNATVAEFYGLQSGRGLKIATFAGVGAVANAGVDFDAQHADASLMTFSLGGSEKSRIDNSGRLLVGTTTTSAAPLTVNGTTNANSSRYRAVFGNGYVDADSNDTDGANCSEIQIQAYQSNRPPVLSLGGAQGENELLGKINFFNSTNTDTKRSRAVIVGAQSGTDPDQGGTLAFRTAADGATSPTSRMVIDSDGNVGIGTTDPTVLLDLESTSPTIRLTDSDAAGTPECQISGAGGDLIFDADRDNEKGTSLIGFNLDGTRRVTIHSGGYVSFNNNGYIRTDDANFLTLQPGASGVKFLNVGGGSESARIDNVGRLLVGTSTSRAVAGNTGQIQLEGSTTYQSIAVTTNRNDTTGAYLFLAKSRGTANGSNTVVQSGDTLGGVFFIGADGSSSSYGASIVGQVDGTPGANDMPGRLIFQTTADGADSPTERMRIGANARIEMTQPNSSQPALYINASSASYTQPIIQSLSGSSASSSWSTFFGYSNSGSDVKFNLRGDGNGYCDGSWTGGGADYAEYFEWSDGNTAAEDRRGISVVLDGDKIREAVTGEEPIGVISGNPSVVGDGDIDAWKGKYLRDDFGSIIREPHNVISWKGENGETVSYEDWRLPEDVVVPDEADISAVNENGKIFDHPKPNPDYNPELEYVSREDRPEWDCVGLMGKLRIRKGQVTGSRWIKMRDISDSVEEWLVR